MQTICSVCKKILSEKCAKCSTVVYWGNPAPMKPRSFWCRCGHIWAPGEDPVSHSYCPPCQQTAIHEMQKELSHAKGFNQ
jgi:hypothetical protein